MTLPPVFMLFLGYATLFLIGIGPSLWLISNHNPRRIALAICITPVVGLAETGLIFYPLVLNDMPIVRTAYPVTLLTIAISICLLAFDVRHNTERYKRIAQRRGVILVGIGLVLAT